MGGTKKARQAVTDIVGVQLQGSGNVLYTTDTDAEVVDLISEGEIEGLVSGSWSFQGKNQNAALDKGQTGYTFSNFSHYSATGISMDNDATEYNRALGFLRSVYWNDTPVVDQNGFYNFSNINIEVTKGLPEGSITASSLNSKLPSSETMDLSVERSIGERLYGVSTQGGTLPSATTIQQLPNIEAIDVVAKTYTLINKHCTKVLVRVKVSQLFEQIATQSSKDTNNFKEGYTDYPDNVGYGDVKARTIKYNIYVQPIFDSFPDSVDGDNAPPRTWQLEAQESIKGYVNQSYVRSTSISFDQDYIGTPGFSGWRIKIIRLTPESLTSYLKSVSHVDSIVEIYGTKLRYPYSAMIYSKFSAEFFNQIPQRSYDTKLTKVRIPNNYDPIKKTYGRSDAFIKSTGDNYIASTQIKVSQLIYFQNGAIMKAHETISAGTHDVGSGGLNWPPSVWVRKGDEFGNNTYPQLNDNGATIQGFSGGTDDDNFWDGGFKQIDTWPVGVAAPYPNPVVIEKEWSDNPAWGFYDLVTNPRYGLGEFIEDVQIDKWSLYEIAQYSDVLVPDGYGYLEPRFTMNHIIVSREEAYKVLNELVSVFRGMLYYSNGLIHAVQDAYKLPLYQFNNSNVIDGDFNYSSSAKKARHTVALVRYIDKYSLFTPAVEYVEDQEGIKRYGLRQIETTALGCTSRGQARRFGDWILTSEAQETESITFSVGQDGAYIKPGDIVQVYDQFRTPQHFAGRTNLVNGIGVAPSNINYLDSAPVNQNGSVTGNSIVIDNAVHFDANSTYKFSLLTPTYNYEDASDMDSDGISEMRRSNLQTLYFLGYHTETVSGYYNSNYEEGGSGIATKIYFHTGLMVDGEPIGTGNQLDFDNYVITGYTNNYVQGPEAYITEAYSGGCFSGANLVWSIENNDTTNPEFISGNFTDYRIINITEDSEKNSYNIQGLQYSSGKYEDVEDRLSFQNPLIQERPQWPYLYTASSQYKSVADNVSIIASHPTLQNLVNGQWENDEKNSKQYSTVEIRFAQAALKLIQGNPQGNVGTANERVPFNIDTNASSTVIDSMTYSVCIYDTPDINDAGFGDTTLTVSDFSTAGETTILHPLSSISTDTNFVGNYLNYSVAVLDGDPNNFISKDGGGGAAIDPNAKIPGSERSSEIPIVYNADTQGLFFFERPLLVNTNYWVAIVARNNKTNSAHAIVGLIPSSYYEGSAPIKINRLPSNATDSRIRGVEIHSMTSENFAGTGTESQDELNELTSNQPTFSWLVGQDLQFVDDYDRILQYPNSFDYRITIRKFDEDISPSPDIFVELTGLAIATQEPAFSFLTSYNNPNTIENLKYNPDVIRYDAAGNSGNLANGLVSIQNTEWYREDTSGVIFRNNPNEFPLRKFDIVVEAHDSKGRTSANNRVWQNTITVPEEAESFSKGGGYDGEGEGYDNYPGYLPVPSGIVFAQGWTNPIVEGAETNSSLDDYHFLTPTGGYVRNYPYTASAAAYTDGTLKISIEPSIDSAGNRILSEGELSNIFNDIEGIICYYSTGNNTMVDVIENGQITFDPLNKAPYFNFQPTAVSNSSAYGYLGSVAYQKTVAEGGDISYWNPPVTKPAGWGVANPDKTNMKTMRWYKHFNGIIPDLSEINIKFPSIGSSLVDNIYLTIGFYDSLSALQHFDGNGIPKTVTINKPEGALYKQSQKNYEDGSAGFPAETGPQDIPTILLDPNINFSTLPKDLWGSIYRDANNDKKRDILKWALENHQAAGTPIFLKERSLITDSQSALAYRAWFDVTLDPGEAYMVSNGQNRLYMDFGIRDNEALYRGPFRQKPISLDVVKFSNKNKLKGFSKIEFEATETWKPGTANQLAAGNLTLYFEQEYEPASYTVDVEFKQANLATQHLNSSDLSNNVKMTDSFIGYADGEPNINPNQRDLITSDASLPNCALVEKSRKYVKFRLSPFYIPAVGNFLFEEMMSGEYEFVEELHISAGDLLAADFPDRVASNALYQQGYFSQDKIWVQRKAAIESNDLYKPFVRVKIPIDNYYEWREAPVTSTAGSLIGTPFHNQSWTHKTTGGGQSYSLSYLQKRGIETSKQDPNDVYYGWIPNTQIYYQNSSLTWDKWDGITEKLKISVSYTPELELPKAKVPSEAGFSLQEKVGSYLEELIGKQKSNISTNDYAFLGNIIKIKGGILLTDKFDNG